MSTEERSDLKFSGNITIPGGYASESILMATSPLMAT